MTPSMELIPRILRDIDDGVLALDLHGRIIYINRQCAEMLGREEDLTGRSYAEVFSPAGPDSGNDLFHQCILDAVYQKDGTHRATVPFTDRQGRRRHISLTASFLRSDRSVERDGIVLVLSDVTESEALRAGRREAATVFTCVASCLSLYLLLLAALDFFDAAVSTKLLTQVLNGMFLFAAVLIYRKNPFPRSELVLKRPAETLGTAAAVSALVVALLMGVKLVMVKLGVGLFDAEAPFWNWSIGIYSWVSYLCTCVVQEFLARSMIYRSIRRLYDGKYALAVAIAVSTLLFGALHVAHGLMYTVASMLLLGCLCRLYERQGNIWGVAVIHYVLGQSACCLGFLS